MIRRRGPAKAENHERWLITYADLITLLLVYSAMALYNDGAIVVLALRP